MVYPARLVSPWAFWLYYIPQKYEPWLNQTCRYASKPQKSTIRKNMGEVFTCTWPNKNSILRGNSPEPIKAHLSRCRDPFRWHKGRSVTADRKRTGYGAILHQLFLCQTDWLHSTTLSEDARYIKVWFMRYKCRLSVTVWVICQIIILSSYRHFQVVCQMFGHLSDNLNSTLLNNFLV